MKRIIVAFEKDAVCREVRAILESGGIAVREQHNCGSNVIRALRTMGGGIVVCGGKLSDMSIGELAGNLLDCALLLVVAPPQLLQNLDGANITGFPTPYKNAELLSAVREMLKAEEEQPWFTCRHRAAEDENLIRAAKELLMKKNRLTEEQAYRLMQRGCMDRCMKMEQAAKMILKTFGVKDGY